MTTEEKVLKIVKKSKGKSNSSQIAKELKISSSYVDFILKTLQTKGKVKLSGRLVFSPEDKLPSRALSLSSQGKPKRRRKEKVKKTIRAKPLAEKPKIRRKKTKKLWPKKALQRFFGWLRQNRKM